MNDFLSVELDLIESPFQKAFTINKIPEIGFTHLILDNLLVESDYIKRMYILSSTESTTRGNHAHLNQFQILILINGEAKLNLTDSLGNSTEWNLAEGPVFIPREHWIELFLDKSTKVLCLASSTYAKLQTIHKKRGISKVMSAPKKISIISPMFNNEGSVQELFKRIYVVFTQHIKSRNYVVELIIVDDGSSDNTYKAVKQEVLKYSCFTYKIIKLTRNFGSYDSFLAGMNFATGDCCVYLHADLQDPPELIPQLIENYEKGFKLVIANRENREDESVFSAIYHWLIKNFGIKNIPPGGFDLILFDKSIKTEIVKIAEKDTNVVYLISWLGYPYVSIPYTRKKREHGKSQWSFWKKVRLFVNSIFSFTDLPTYFLRSTVMISFILLISSVIFDLILNLLPYPYLSFILAAVLFMFSINLVIIFEYIIRTHESIRNRPNFVVDSIEENPDKNVKETNKN